MKVADKRVQWFEAGSSYSVINDDPSAEWRQICWEIKKPPRHTEKEVRDLLANATYSTDVGTSLLFEVLYFCEVLYFFWFLFDPKYEG